MAVDDKEKIAEIAKTLCSIQLVQGTHFSLDPFIKDFFTHNKLLVFFLHNSMFSLFYYVYSVYLTSI